MKPSCRSKVYVPDKTSIVSTSDVDGVNALFGYYSPFSYPMRRRLNMVVEAMEKKTGYQAILDAGFGCGILLTDLYRKLAPGSGQLYGIDVHGQHEAVKASLVAREGLEAGRIHLSNHSLFDLPFEDDTFDLIVSVSVLEHIQPNLLPACLREIRRVAKSNAEIILGFPTDSIFIRLLALLHKQDIRKNHPSTHHDIFGAIAQAGFQIIEKSSFPRFAGPLTMHYNVRIRNALR
ncbi:MAG: class I SAM-dependent methyltransferase [Magnetococcales bacterium]|nr:class I SAM-dependent methyltransferase [Magnetococcales bacterium]